MLWRNTLLQHRNSCTFNQGCLISETAFDELDDTHNDDDDDENTCWGRKIGWVSLFMSALGACMKWA